MSVAESPSRGKRRILVIEDEYLIAEDIALSLEDLNYEVVGPVPTVDEALALIEFENLDGALLDANLGGTSSAPVAAELVSRSVPFVVVTGYGQLDLPNSMLSNAPRVTKPYNMAELGRTLAEALRPPPIDTPARAP